MIVIVEDHRHFQNWMDGGDLLTVLCQSKKNRVNVCVLVSYNARFKVLNTTMHYQPILKVITHKCPTWTYIS